MSRAACTVAAAVALLLVAGCGDKPQTAGGSRADTAPFQGTGLPYVASGWKSGDKGSWEAQLKTRTQQGQNDYVKAN